MQVQGGAHDLASVIGDPPTPGAGDLGDQAVRVEAHGRQRLEQLCRYITRPPLSDERVPLNAAGQLKLKPKTPWRDGTTHLVMSPLELMQRLAGWFPGRGCT